jgi:hypothetical protein
MNLRTAGAAALFAALLLLAPPVPRTSASARQQGTTARQDSVVLLVTKGDEQGAQVEPVSTIDGRGALAEPELGTGSDGAPSAFIARHYQPGAKYRLIYGGAEAGFLTIRAATPAECSPNAASAELGPTAAKLGGNVMALATDHARTQSARASRRAPTAAERAAAFAAAKRFLLGKRVSASERNTKTINLTATDLDGDGREELVGSYVVKTGPRVRDTLFLVAAPQGKGFQPVLTKYARVNAREMMDASQIDNLGEGGFGMELYVEQLDADGDGVGEVFTLSGSFEGTTYRAYRRERGTWRAVYENYSYRCAY